MEKEVAQIFNGWLSLSDSQKMKIIGMIQDYQRGGDHTKRELRESVMASVTKMHTGPLGDSCRCCGR
jgi:hypothetical protein